MTHAKPCPKCGGSAVRTVTMSDKGGGWSECLAPRCRFVVYAAEDDPAVKWNEIARLVANAKRGAA